MTATRMRPEKPASVSSDPYRSKKWDEVVRGYDLGPEDVPALTLLVQWYQVVDQCIEDLSAEGGGIRVAQECQNGELKAMPQLATMQKASAEIRQLCKQLGMRRYHDAADAGDEGAPSDAPRSKLQLIQERHDAYRKRAV